MLIQFVSLLQLAVELVVFKILGCDGFSQSIQLLVSKNVVQCLRRGQFCRDQVAGSNVGLRITRPSALCSQAQGMTPAAVRCHLCHSVPKYDKLFYSVSVVTEFWFNVSSVVQLCEACKQLIPGNDQSLAFFSLSELTVSENLVITLVSWTLARLVFLLDVTLRTLDYGALR